MQQYSSVGMARSDTHAQYHMSGIGQNFMIKNKQTKKL